MKVMNYISCFWGRLASSTLCEMVALVGDMIPLPELAQWQSQRDRIFNQWRTFWLFLGQILNVNQSCQEALKKAQFWLSFSAPEKKRFHLIRVAIVKHGAD